MSRTYWAGEMAGDQIALFHFDGKSRVMCHPDGKLGGVAIQIS